MTVNLLWTLFNTAVRLEDRAERQAIYDASALLYEALNLSSFLIPSGEYKIKVLGGMFRNVVRQDTRLVRDTTCSKALPWLERLCIHGIAKIA